MATFSVVSYYTCLIALSVYYLIASCASVLPWTVCDPDVQINNTVCIPSGGNKTQIMANLTLEGVIEHGQNVSTIGSAEQYFL